MLRKLIVSGAIVAALAAGPTAASARPMGGFGHGGMHAGGMHSFGGMRGFAGPARFGAGHGFVGARNFNRFGAFPRHRFARFHHFRHGRNFPFFVAGLGVGAAYAYGTCWNWVPTPYGWRYVWVCGYPY
jgi:hypothetical protein